MAFSARQDLITTTAGTGSQAVSGLGFAPKALLAWETGQQAEGFTTGLRLAFGIGQSSTARFGICGHATDAVAAASEAGRSLTATRILETVGGAAETTETRYDLTSLDADGFTLNKVTNITGTLLHYLALGGADVTNAFVGTFTGLTAAGDLAVTGVGFQPDLVIFIQAQRITAGTSGDMTHGIGMMTPAAQWGLAVSQLDTSANPAAKSSLRSDSCLIGLSVGGGNLNLRCNFVSMDSDGFTIHYTTAPTSAHTMPFLALKGGSYKVGTFQKSTGGAPVDDDVTVGFQPKAVLLTSIHRATTTTIQADAVHALGAGDGTRNGAIWIRSTDAADPTDANRSIINSKALRLATQPNTVAAECDLDLASVSNGFRAHWTTNDAVAAEVAYLAVGDAKSAPMFRPA